MVIFMEMGILVILSYLDIAICYRCRYPKYVKKEAKMMPKWT